MNALTANGADIVIGSRFLEKDKNEKSNNSIPKFYNDRIRGMKVLNWSTEVAGNMKTTDSQSGYRAYSRRAIALNITNKKTKVLFYIHRKNRYKKEAKKKWSRMNNLWSDLFQE